LINGVGRRRKCGEFNSAPRPALDTKSGGADFSIGDEFLQETTPLPCFLEVLILKDFKSFEPEVLILMDFKSLFPEVLILVGLKLCVINEMREIGKFSEVLIPGGLSGAKCTNDWI
jgi:hypothetical protein